MYLFVGLGVILVLICGLLVVVYLFWYFDISFDGFWCIVEFDDEVVKFFGVGSWLSFVGIVILSIFIGLYIFMFIEVNYKVESEG